MGSVFVLRVAGSPAKATAWPVVMPCRSIHYPASFVTALMTTAMAISMKRTLKVVLHVRFKPKGSAASVSRTALMGKLFVYRTHYLESSMRSVMVRTMTVMVRPMKITLAVARSVTQARSVNVVAVRRSAQAVSSNVLRISLLHPRPATSGTTIVTAQQMKTL